MEEAAVVGKALENCKTIPSNELLKIQADAARKIEAEQRINRSQKNRRANSQRYEACCLGSYRALVWFLAPPGRLSPAGTKSRKRKKEQKTSGIREPTRNVEGTESEQEPEKAEPTTKRKGFVPFCGDRALA